jgi:hypothetical protein
MRWSDKSKGMDAPGSRPGLKPVATRPFDAPVERASGVGFSRARELAAGRHEFAIRKRNDAAPRSALGAQEAQLSRDARHERAVARSCQLAQQAADIDDFAEALAWLKTVEAVDGPLAPRWDAKRASWRRQGDNGTPRTDRRFQPPAGAAVDASQEGRR